MSVFEERRQGKVNRVACRNRRFLSAVPLPTPAILLAEGSECELNARKTKPLVLAPLQFSFYERFGDADHVSPREQSVCPCTPLSKNRTIRSLPF